MLSVILYMLSVILYEAVVGENFFIVYLATMGATQSSTTDGETLPGELERNIMVSASRPLLPGRELDSLGKVGSKWREVVPRNVFCGSEFASSKLPFTLIPHYDNKRKCWELIDFSHLLGEFYSGATDKAALDSSFKEVKRVAESVVNHGHHLTTENREEIDGLFREAKLVYKGRLKLLQNLKHWVTTSVDGDFAPEMILKVAGFDGLTDEQKNKVPNVMIPKDVAEMGDGAFSESKALTHVTIPSSVTRISRFAFASCTSLTHITIPSKVTVIYLMAFYGCSALTHVTIPSSVTWIGYSAFTGCSALTHVTIPEGVTMINDETFCDCSSLTHVKIPEGVTEIGKEAFRNCTQLTHVTIPHTVTTIRDYAFENCKSLTQVEIPIQVIIIDKTAFSEMTSIIRTGA